MAQTPRWRKTITASRVFNPSMHPRGKDGKFIDKFGFVKFFINGKETRGQVVDFKTYDSGKTTKLTVRVDGSSNKRNDASFVNLDPKNVVSVTPDKARLDKLTIADLDNALDWDDRYSTGWGYNGVRNRFERDIDDPEIAAEMALKDFNADDVDKLVVDRANATGMSYEALAEWVNTRDARYFSDEVSDAQTKDDVSKILDRYLPLPGQAKPTAKKKLTDEQMDLDKYNKDRKAALDESMAQQGRINKVTTPTPADTAGRLTADKRAEIARELSLLPQQDESTQVTEAEKRVAERRDAADAIAQTQQNDVPSYPSAPQWYALTDTDRARVIRELTMLYQDDSTPENLRREAELNRLLFMSDVAESDDASRPIKEAELVAFDVENGFPVDNERGVASIDRALAILYQDDSTPANKNIERRLNMARNDIVPPSMSAEADRAGYTDANPVINTTNAATTKGAKLVVRKPFKSFAETAINTGRVVTPAVQLKPGDVIEFEGFRQSPGSDTYGVSRYMVKLPDGSVKAVDEGYNTRILDPKNGYIEVVSSPYTPTPDELREQEIESIKRELIYIGSRPEATPQRVIDELNNRLADLESDDTTTASAATQLDALRKRVHGSSS